MNFISCYVFKILDISSLVSAKVSVALLNTAIVLVFKALQDVPQPCSSPWLTQALGSNTSTTKEKMLSKCFRNKPYCIF